MLVWRNCHEGAVSLGKFCYSKRFFTTKDTKDTKEKPLLV
jgi:hypothetical protein